MFSGLNIKFPNQKTRVCVSLRACREREWFLESRPTRVFISESNTRLLFSSGTVLSLEGGTKAMRAPSPFPALALLPILMIKQNLLRTGQMQMQKSSATNFFNRIILILIYKSYVRYVLQNYIHRTNLRNWNTEQDNCNAPPLQLVAVTPNPQLTSTTLYL